jgi:hypothetical protein
VKTFGWRAQQEVGEMGVRRVSEYLQANGFYVGDVTDDASYRAQDIDLVVLGKNRKRSTTVEVKTDTNKTGNIFLELVASSGRPGCVFGSRAQVWLYWLPTLGTLLYIELPRLQLWLVEHAGEYERKVVGSRRGKGAWHIEGIAVPIRQLVTDGIARRLRLAEEIEEAA